MRCNHCTVCRFLRNSARVRALGTRRHVLVTQSHSASPPQTANGQRYRLVSCSLGRIEVQARNSHRRAGHRHNQDARMKKKTLFAVRFDLMTVGREASLCPLCHTHFRHRCRYCGRPSYIKRILFGARWSLRALLCVPRVHADSRRVLMTPGLQRSRKSQCADCRKSQCAAVSTIMLLLCSLWVACRRGHQRSPPPHFW